MLFGKGGNQWQQLGFGQFVDFVESEDGFRATAFGFFDEKAVGMREHGGGIGDEQEDVDAFEGRRDFAHHLLVQDGGGFVQAGRVDENDLPFRTIDDALNAVAGSLRLGSDDGDFLADETIEQRGFTGVGAADDSDEAGALAARLFRGVWHVGIVASRRGEKQLRVYCSACGDGREPPSGLARRDFWCVRKREVVLAESSGKVMYHRVLGGRREEGPILFKKPQRIGHPGGCC